MAKKRAAQRIEAGSATGAEPEAAGAPKRRGRPKGAGDGPKGNVLSLRGSQAWRAWVGRLADHSRLKVADVIDRALVAYARQEGFHEPAPRR